jgi:hypothetical protein
VPRRSPGQIRHDPPYAHLDPPIATLPGLSPRGVAAIARLERTRFWPGAAREALDAWALFLSDPYHRLFDPAYGCGVRMCCPDPAELRGVLRAVAHALPRQDARAFRRRLAGLDERW